VIGKIIKKENLFHPQMLPLTNKIHFQKQLLEDALQFYLGECPMNLISFQQFRSSVDECLAVEHRIMEELLLPTSIEEHVSKISEQVRCYSIIKQL